MFEFHHFKSIRMFSFHFDGDILISMQTTPFQVEFAFRNGFFSFFFTLLHIAPILIYLKILSFCSCKCTTFFYSLWHTLFLLINKNSLSFCRFYMVNRMKCACKGHGTLHKSFHLFLFYCIYIPKNTPLQQTKICANICTPLLRWYNGELRFLERIN